jgi:hypothetical protein
MLVHPRQGPNIWITPDLDLHVEQFARGTVIKLLGGAKAGQNLFFWLDPWDYKWNPFCSANCFFPFSPSTLSTYELVVLGLWWRGCSA